MLRPQPLLTCFAAAALSLTLLAARPAGAQSAAMAIRPGDLVEVKVFREEDMSGKVRVSALGDVNLPLIGLVRVGGQSPESASDAIKAKLADGYLVQPEVMVTVSEYAKLLYTVLGQVQKPGSYEIPATGNVTLLQAVGVAGGYTRIANPGKVILKRTIGGRERIIEINAKRLGKEAGGAPVLVLPGDVITVSESMF